MPNAKPIVGKNAKVVVTPYDDDGILGSPVTLKNANWKLNQDPSLKVAPNTSDGILRAAGMEDYEGSVEGALDDTAGNRIEQNVQNGTTVKLDLYRDATHFWSCESAIIGKFSENTGADELDEWTFDFAKNGGDLIEPNYGS